MIKTATTTSSRPGHAVRCRTRARALAEWWQARAWLHLTLGPRGHALGPGVRAERRAQAADRWAAIAVAYAECGNASEVGRAFGLHPSNVGRGLRARGLVT